MGVIDHLCPAGQGEAAARAFIDEHATRRKARLAVQRARARLHPLDYAELAAEAADWVEVALQLNEEQQRLLHTLARMQHSDLAAFH